MFTTNVVNMNARHTDQFRIAALGNSTPESKSTMNSEFNMQSTQLANVTRFDFKLWILLTKIVSDGAGSAKPQVYI